MMATAADRIARQFYHTRSFHYRLMTGSSAASSSRSNQPKLYTTLRDAPGYTSDSQAIFPNLTTAYFEQVPADGGEYSYKSTFLSNITIVHLEHSRSSLYDSPPDFHTLGMQDVREIHMYHLAGCEVTHDFMLGKCLNYQASLERVYFHLSAHFANTVGGDDQRGNRRIFVNGILQAPRRSLDATIYIQEYADAVAMVSASVAYAQMTASSRYHRVYPALREVIIDVGSDGQLAQQMEGQSQQAIHSEYTDKQLLVERCKQRMLKYRERAERQQAQGVHVAQAEGQKKTMPDIYLLEGGRQKGWILSDSGPSSESQPSDRAKTSERWISIAGC